MEASGLGTPTSAHLPPRRFFDDSDNGGGDDGSRDDDAYLPTRRSTRSPLEVVRVLSHPKHRVAATKADLKTILTDHIRCFFLTMVCGMFVRQNGTAPWNL